MKAWYFSDATKKLRHGDGREIVLGHTHVIDGVPICCERGLHGSERILDALKYAPGTVAWIVELSGDMDKQEDKIAATHRTYLHGGIDVKDIIIAWAKRVALDVAHLWDMPQNVRDWLEDMSRDRPAASAASSAYDACTAAVSAAVSAANAAVNAAAYAAAYAAYTAHAAAANAAANAAAAYAASRTKYSDWLAHEVYNAIMEAEK